MTGIPRLRDYPGPVLLSYGFRPFFLFFVRRQWRPRGEERVVRIGLLREVGPRSDCADSRW
jgi:hypothetical protein